MSLILHRAPRADHLADGLAELLRAPLEDPFAQELVLVPARGVERWLSQRLSHRLGHAEGRDDGVCAGVEFRSPASLVAEVIGTRESDPWAPDALVWPLLTVVDASAGEAWCAHLEHAPRPWQGRRGARAAPRTSLRRRPASGATVRCVRRATAVPARRVGAARRHRRSRPRSPGRPDLAARALAPTGRRGGGADTDAAARTRGRGAAQGHWGAGPAAAALAVRAHPHRRDRGRAAGRPR